MEKPQPCVSKTGASPNSAEGQTFSAPLLIGQYVLGLDGYRRRQFTSLILEIGCGLHKSSRYVGVRCCLCHLEKRRRCFACVKMLVSHGTQSPALLASGMHWSQDPFRLMCKSVPTGPVIGEGPKFAIQNERSQLGAPRPLGRPGATGCHETLQRCKGSTIRNAACELSRLEFWSARFATMAVGTDL